jgi:hypothetical protein
MLIANIIAVPVTPRSQGTNFNHGKVKSKKAKVKSKKGRPLSTVFYFLLLPFAFLLFTFAFYLFPFAFNFFPYLSTLKLDINDQIHDRVRENRIRSRQQENHP